MKNKSNIILKVFLYLLLIGGVLIILLKENDISGINNHTEGLTLDDTSSYTNTLDIYKMDSIYEEDYMDDICYYYDKDNCNEKFISIKTNTDSAELLYYYKYKYFFYQDGAVVKVYNKDEDKSYTINNVMGDYYTLSFEIDYNTDDFIGVIFAKDRSDKPSFLYVKTGKILYDKKYDSLMLVDGKYLSANNTSEKYDKSEGISRAKDDYVYLLDATEEKKPLLEYKNNSEYFSCNYINEGNNTSIYALYLDMFLKEIYNSDLKVIYTSKSNNDYEVLHSIDLSDNIYVYDENVITMYNSEGKKLKTSNKIDKVEDMIDKYAIVISDALYLTSVDNKSIKITGWTDKLSLIDYWLDKDNIHFSVKDPSVKLDDVYKECKNSECKNMTKEDLNDSDYSYGYEYTYNTKSNKTTKKTTFMYAAGF